MTALPILIRRLTICALLLAALALALPATAAFARTMSVPWMAQKTSSDCGRAVLASLAARRRGNPEAMYWRLPPPPDPVRGYSINDMRRFGARVGVRLSVRAPSGVVIAGDCRASPAVANHYRRLARLVSSGHPVVVPVSSGFGAGHYLILVGASGDTFTAMDPASPGLRQIGMDRLASLMCGFGYIALAN